MELPEKRTATSDTFRLHSGLLETRIYNAPVNYKDSKGEWQPIEEGLEEASGGELVNRGNSFQVSLPATLGEGAARLVMGKEWVASRLLGTETGTARLSEGAASYSSPQAGTSFQYTTLPNGLKEEIELEGPQSPSSFRYELTASPDLEASLAKGGAVVFRDPQGEVVALLPPPSVADAGSSTPTPDSHVSYELAPRGGGGWLLTIAVDPEWLASPERKFPVRIDPTVTKEGSDLECVIGGKTGQEGWVDCASWGRENLLAGYNAELNQAEDSWYRTLMYMRTADIPRGADVSSASLELHAPEAAQNTSGVQARELTKPWDWQANWTHYSAGQLWENEGGDYTSEPLGEETTAQRGSGAGWWTIPIPAAKVQERSEHEEDLSLMVKLADDKQRSCGETSCTHRLVAFDSSAVLYESRHPYLRVVYDFHKAPESSRMASPEEGRVSSNFFTLSSSWGPPPLGETGVTGVTYQIKLPRWKEFRTIPAKYVLNGQGEEVHWPAPVLGNGSTPPVFFDFRDASAEEEWSYSGWWSSEFGQNIKLRAIFAGGPTLKGASEPVTVEYDEHDAPTDAQASVGPANVDLLTGAYTLGATDVSIPVPGTESSLEFSRTYSYLGDSSPSPAFGAGWQPSSPVEQAYEGIAWTKLLERHQPAVEAVSETECWVESGVEECETFIVEEAIPAAEWIELIDSEGDAAAFEISGGSYIAPEYMKEYVLTKDAETGLFRLTDSEGVQTTFKSEGTPEEYVPESVSWQATSQSARMVYEPLPSLHKYRLLEEIAPAPAGVTCNAGTAKTTEGCRALTFQYFTCSCEGTYRLSSIEYYGAHNEGGQTVARYGYDAKYRLAEEWDPRTEVNGNALKETYAYTPESVQQLASVTPPGQEPWQFNYYNYKEFQPEENTGHYNRRDLELFNRLKSVSRASLVEGTPTATTTIAYQVPLSGSGAPYDMSASTVATWGDSDYPVAATAIFPPGQVPSEPRPSDFSHATVHYLDPEGHEVNTASPAPPGAEGPSITTAEADSHGNVTRELSAQNRLRSLAAGSESATLSHQLDSHSVYSSDGTELLESWGPLHQTRLESGETVETRLHTSVEYEDPTPPSGQAPYHLPTRETSGALVSGKDGTFDQRVSQTRYDWNLRLPTETIVDPGTGHLAITSKTVYEESTGLPIETRQPSNPDGGGAASTKTVYYSAATNAAYPECGGMARYAGLTCRITPAAQASGSGRPELLVKRFTSYNNLDEPTEILESPGGGSENVRKTLLTYDAAGRQKTKQIEGGGVAVPKVETAYSATLGLPVAERFKCESQCTPQYQTSIGLASSSHSGLERPGDVAVDAEGNIWALEKGSIFQLNDHLIEYNEAGEFIREVGATGTAGGQLKSPSQITIDSLGNLDVTDTANNRVAQFSPTGAFIEVIGAEVNKTKVEAGGSAAEKNLCTAASGDVCQAGSGGTAEGHISEPVGITTTGGQNIFVVERADNRVEKFNPQGERLAGFGETGSGNGQLKEPSAIAFHGYLLWIADTGNARIEAFTTSYAYSRKFGSEGSGDGQFKKPTGIETDSAGSVWVADGGDGRVQKLTETGGFVEKFEYEGGGVESSLPRGLVLDSAGNILLANPGKNRVEKWSTSDFDSQETRTTYDALGRSVAYQDADGNKAETTYDLEGRPVKATDNKSTQTLRYDPTSGLPVELEDSAAGTFTASYTPTAPSSNAASPTA